MYFKEFLNAKKIDENIIPPKIIKVGGVIFFSLLAIYLTGQVFRITANSIRGYNEFKKSLNGN